MKTIIIDVAPPNISHNELDYRMNELESLVSTYGWVTIVKRVQKRFTPDYRTFVGSGKLDELIAIGEELWAELLIIGNIMKPAQIWNVNEYMRKSKSKIQAWDRVDLILKIFALHADSPEAKLQIELAAIKHMWPRIYGMWMELSRQGWWSKNAKGQGETNTEIMKRHLREKELMLLGKLKTHEKTRSLHRASRKRKWLSTIWIVGYTNAGKSTLMNVLTKKWVLAENKLFATLWTHVGMMHIHDASSVESIKWIDILVNDTIGFIRDLPPNLIAAFKSTLEDSIESDVLLHVMDANDDDIGWKIEVVDAILENIGAKQKRLYVFNKVDMISNDSIQQLEGEYQRYSPIFVSAYSDIGIESLKDSIIKKLHQ